MKVSVDDKEILLLNDTQKKVIKNEIPEDIFQEDMERRLIYILNHKYERCFQRLKTEWEPKLKSRGYRSVPTDNDEFAQLVFAQQDYKNRTQKDSSS